MPDRKHSTSGIGRGAFPARRFPIRFLRAGDGNFCSSFIVFPPAKRTGGDSAGRVGRCPAWLDCSAVGFRCKGQTHPGRIASGARGGSRTHTVLLTGPRGFKPPASAIPPPWLEATGGIEPPYRAFAEPCLTTWLRRRAAQHDEFRLQFQAAGVPCSGLPRVRLRR
ncbi:MAG: hypothetical protein G01um101438_743 [Parcubacteria group bacterium Gr01-1014_38]|nr:MAG: hypothetical protein G01um101438_743 [Parcubacteria group bacterium Gr01-1014_38]